MGISHRTRVMRRGVSVLSAELVIKHVLFKFYAVTRGDEAIGAGLRTTKVTVRQHLRLRIERRFNPETT